MNHTSHNSIANFIRPAPMRTLDEIRADIYALEQETEGLLEQIVGEAE